MAGHIATAKKVSWCTPKWILDACLQVIGESQFDLDPCSNPESLVPARVKYELPVDGLKESWDFENIFCNPPFGRDKVRKTSIINWVAHCAMAGTNRFLLLPASVDTAYWQDIILPSHLNKEAMICLFKGRIKFNGAAACAPMPIALVYFGWEQTTFMDVFEKYGYVF